LPDFDTADIRLRDICTRAQFVGNFKPGRKPKALTARLNHSVNELPALVPIGGNAAKVEPMAELLTDEPQQLYGRAALEPDEEELERELQEQAGAVAGAGARVEAVKIIAPTTGIVELPKLEPFAARTVISSSPKALIKAGARKRYCQELVELTRDLQLQPGDISGDEHDEEAAQLAIIAEERQLKMDTSTRPSNAADKKCIYSTFFKRRPGLEDELVLRSMQSDKMQPLNERNFKKYLRDYKRRKLQQPVSTTNSLKYREFLQFLIFRKLMERKLN